MIWDFILSTFIFKGNTCNIFKYWFVRERIKPIKIYFCFSFTHQKARISFPYLIGLVIFVIVIYCVVLHSFVYSGTTETSQTSLILFIFKNSIFRLIGTLFKTFTQLCSLKQCCITFATSLLRRFIKCIIWIYKFWCLMQNQKKKKIIKQKRVNKDVFNKCFIIFTSWKIKS